MMQRANCYPHAGEMRCGAHGISCRCWAMIAAAMENDTTRTVEVIRDDFGGDFRCVRRLLVRGNQGQTPRLGLLTGDRHPGLYGRVGVQPASRSRRPKGKVVRSKGIEPSRVAPQRPQRCASTISATTARLGVISPDRAPGIANRPPISNLPRRLMKSPRMC